MMTTSYDALRLVPGQFEQGLDELVHQSRSDSSWAMPG